MAEDRLAELSKECRALEGRYTQAKNFLSIGGRGQLCEEVIARIKVLFQAYDLRQAAADSSFTLGQIREAMNMLDAPEAVVRKYEYLKDKIKDLTPKLVEPS